MPNLSLSITLILTSSALFAQAYKDSKSGFEILEIQPPADGVTNLYYHCSNYTANDSNILFAAGGQLWRYDVAAARSVVVTSGPGVAAASAAPHPTHANLVYYPRGAAVEEIDLATGKLRQVGVVPQPLVGGLSQPSFTPDLRHVALSRQRDAANWEIGLMDVTTGAWRSVAVVGFRVGHVQHHPKLPLIFFVWETGGYAPQRTWVVNDDGTGLRPFYFTTEPKEWLTPLKEWVTHESWIASTGGMTLIIDKLGIVVADATGKGHLIPGQYWHVHASDDGRRLVTDDMAGNLWLIDVATENRRLLATGLRDAVRAVHAHASFDHSGRFVMFNTGRTRQTLGIIDLRQIETLVAH
jgi:hypothetical protein